MAGTNEVALGWVARRYGPALLAYLVRLVGDYHLAEEILQDTLLRFWLQEPALKPEVIKGWLYKVAKHRAIDALRARPPWELGEPPDGEVAAAEVGAVARWARAEVAAAMQALPEVYQQAITLRYYRELKYDEMAQRLAIPVGTAKSRVSYGLRRLRGELKRRGLDAAALR